MMISYTTSLKPLKIIIQTVPPQTPDHGNVGVQIKTATIEVTSADGEPFSVDVDGLAQLPDIAGKDLSDIWLFVLHRHYGWIRVHMSQADPDDTDRPSGEFVDAERPPDKVNQI